MAVTNGASASSITSDQVPGKRSPGSLSWGGINNTFFWIDPAKGIAGVIMMQYLPFADAKALAVYDIFERGDLQARGSRASSAAATLRRNAGPPRGACWLRLLEQPDAPTARLRSASASSPRDGGRLAAGRSARANDNVRRCPAALSLIAFFIEPPFDAGNTARSVKPNRFAGRSFLFIFQPLGFPTWNEQTRCGLDPTRPCGP